MAVPSRVTSKAKGRSRRAHWKLSSPNLVECPSATNRCWRIEYARIADTMLAKLLLKRSDLDKFACFYIQFSKQS